MSAIFEIEITNGKLQGLNRNIFKKQFDSLDDGRYRVKFERKKSNCTRYRFYFDCIMSFALPAAQKVFKIQENGVLRPPRNTKELHEIVKGIFNPVVIFNQETGEQIVKGGTTTTLSDKDFIGEYMEKVIAYFSNEPFDVVFMDFQEWGQLYSEGNWHTIKYLATTDI